MQIDRWIDRSRGTPVTLPIALSALSSALIASMEAKVSGSDVPSATRLIEVTVSVRPTKQPKMDAKSEMSVLQKPTRMSAQKKHGKPPPMCAGGIKAARTCKRTHSIVREHIL